MPGRNATPEQAKNFCCVKCFFHVLIVIVPALPCGIVSIRDVPSPAVPALPSLTMPGPA
jgi:hypothetical protein